VYSLATTVKLSSPTPTTGWSPAIVQATFHKSSRPAPPSSVVMRFHVAGEIENHTSAAPATTAATKTTCTR
jgi:hypothetical protein